jgi:hypothetical protein
MPVPMGLNTVCVCDSMRSACVPREILFGALNIQGPPRGSCGFYRVATQLVWDFIGTRMRFIFQILMPVPMGLNTVCVCDSIRSA